MFVGGFDFVIMGDGKFVGAGDCIFGFPRGEEIRQTNRDIFNSQALSKLLHFLIIMTLSPVRVISNQAVQFWNVLDFSLMYNIVN